MKKLITHTLLKKNLFCYDVLNMKQMMQSLGEGKLIFIESFKFVFFLSGEILIRQM